MGPAMVSCKVMRALTLIAQSAGITLDSLDQAQLADPDARFPYDAWLAALDAIARQGPAPYGLRAAAALPAGHFDVLDYVMTASDDFGSALARFVKYFAIVSTASTFELHESDDGAVRLERRVDASAHTSFPHPAEFALANVVLRARTMTGVALRPREVRFAHARPADDREHRTVFDCAVRFDAGMDAIVFDRSVLTLPMLKPEPELARVLERHAGALLAALPAVHPDLRAEVKGAIVRGLKDDRSGVDAVAKQLGISGRTLQRRLGEVGTSHAELLEEARSELAQRYLREPTVEIAEIAFLLGFADASAFHRAFRRWTGATPAEHRRRVRAESRPG